MKYARRVQAPGTAPAFIVRVARLNSGDGLL